MTNMRKFLFVSFTSEQAYTGGIQCTNRNFQTLVALFGADNVSKYIIMPYKNRKSIISILQRIRDIFRGYMGGMRRTREKEILQIIKEKQITDLFIDSSLLGILALKVKRKIPNIRIYTFFHNYEYAFVRDSIVVNRSYSRLYWLILAYINEKIACKYSDKIISLNNRDKEAINKMYKKLADIQIPITLSTSYTPTNKAKQIVASGQKSALFVGSYFFGNVQGIKWFCKNVLPLTNIHLTIVGSGMEKLKDEIEMNKQISIYNNVPDLTPYYENSDFVILPILSGSGMKVKTAEALMYGKYIIGTTEALRGYEINEKIGIICDSIEEFCKAINSFENSYKFNIYSRNLFEQKYSFENSLRLFEQVLE